MLACYKQSLFCSKTCARAASCAGAQGAVPTLIKSAQFQQELETARRLVYSQGPHFHVRDSSSIKIVGDLWKASARGWGWAAESRSSQRSGGGGNPGEQGAGGVRETGEERSGSGISTMGGKRDRNSKRQAFVVCYCLSSSQRNEPNNNPLPSPPPNMKSGQCQDCKPHFYFFRLLVRWLLLYFLLCYFFPFASPFFKYNLYFSL